MALHCYRRRQCYRRGASVFLQLHLIKQIRMESVFLHSIAIFSNVFVVRFYCRLFQHHMRILVGKRYVSLFSRVIGR